MRILAELGFIDIAEGPNGPISHVLIYNPYQIVMKHFEDGSINVASFNALKQRMIEIGAQDLDEAETEAKSGLKSTKDDSAKKLDKLLSKPTTTRRRTRRSKPVATA